MLKDDFRSGQPLAAIPARWLREVAKILNTLTIEMVDVNDLPSIYKPPMPTPRNPWTIRVPRAQGGAGIPEGTEIWGKVRAERLTGSSAPQGDGTYVYQGKLVWDGAAFVPKETEAGEPVEELVAFVPDATLPAFTFVSGIAMENGRLVANRTRWDGSAFVSAGQQTISPSATQSFEFKRLAWQGDVLRQGTTRVTITAILGSISVNDLGLYDDLFGVEEHPANEATPYDADTENAVTDTSGLPEDDA